MKKLIDRTLGGACWARGAGRLGSKDTVRPAMSHRMRTAMDAVIICRASCEDA
jgi:hypothetical protein